MAAACKKSETKQETPPAASEPKKEAQPAPTEKPATGEKTAKVHCMGVNDCSGKGACKTPANDCAGKNGCTGKGFIDMPEEDCKGKGGTTSAVTSIGAPSTSNRTWTRSPIPKVPEPDSRAPLIDRLSMVITTPGLWRARTMATFDTLARASTRRSS